MPLVTKTLSMDGKKSSATYDRYVLGEDTFTSHPSTSGITYDVTALGTLSHYDSDVTWARYVMTEITNATSAKIFFNATAGGTLDNAMISSASSGVTFEVDELDVYDNESITLLNLSGSGGSSLHTFTGSIDLSASQVSKLNSGTGYMFLTADTFLRSLSRVYNQGTGTGKTGGGLTSYTREVATCSFEFKDSGNYIEYTCYAPAIDTFTVTGTSIDSNIVCSWTGEDIASWTVQAIKGGVVKATKTGTTATSCTFSVGEFTEAGEYTFKLIATNNASVEETEEVTLTNTVPVVDDFTVTGTSIDSNVVCTWTGTNVSSWTLTASLNGVVKATKTGTTAATCTFTPSDFTAAGEYTFTLTAIHSGVGYTTTAVSSAKAKMTCTYAVINLLELPSSTINTSEAFTITWVSSNQTSFSLTIDNKTYTGTTQKSATVPANAIGKGTKQVSLTITYNNGRYSNTDTETTSFVGYGKPDAPVLTTKSSYSSATPSLSWESDEQTAYRVVIKQALTTTEDSNDTISANRYYVTTTSLSNNTNYTVSVKVKNKYNLWSDESTASFVVQFTVPSVPAIQAISDISTGSIIITVLSDVTNDTEYKNTEIWKREINGEWKRMAYKLNFDDIWQDFYVAGNTNYEYKARNVGKSGGISESDIIIASTIVKGCNFYDVENNNNFLRFETGDAPTPRLNQSITTNLFANACAPSSFTDGTLYWTCSLKFTTTDREDIEKVYRLLKAKLLLYKDNKGHKWFGNIVNDVSFPEDDVEIITIQIDFTQSQFTEEDVYTGDNLTLITWNGGWKFDGSHVFGGE